MVILATVIVYRFTITPNAQAQQSEVGNIEDEVTSENMQRALNWALNNQPEEVEDLDVISLKFINQIDVDGLQSTLDGLIGKWIIVTDITEENYSMGSNADTISKTDEATGATANIYFDTTLDNIINNGCDSYVGYVLPDGEDSLGCSYYIFGGYAYIDLGAFGGNIVSDNSDNIFSAEPSSVLDVTLTDPSAFPSNTQLIDTEYYLDIAKHDYSYNRSWIDNHADQWVRIDGLISDIRMMDSIGQYPELYCFLDYSEDFGLENYGDFRVIGWDNMMCIPLADRLSENYYMYLVDDGYGVMGINAQAVEGDISSDPTGPNGEPPYLYPSDSKYITDDELRQFTHDEIVLIRNEIYARHGCNFNNIDIQSYFESQSWYHPVDGLNASNFDSSILNDYELANIDTILAYERKMGWRS